MATGDQNDILTRLKALMPNGWFTGGLAPLRDALLTGWANMFAFAYSALAYVRNQTRIATASDGFLDLIAADYFGQNLVRGSNQSDASFRATILANLIRQRVTRASVASVLTPDHRPRADHLRTAAAGGHRGPTRRRTAATAPQAATARCCCRSRPS